MNKLSIIVPYRNRPEHLKKFVSHMTSFLSDKINYEILFIEQNDENPFNRGKLLNVGVNLCNDSDYYCFHDVDMLPVNNDCDYSFLNGVCKLSKYVGQFNFLPRPDEELGGVTLIDKQSFLLVNGYCNNYWGWGVEDNDFALRCKVKNILFICRDGKFMSLPHKPNGDTYGGVASDNTIKNRQYFNSVKENNEIFLNGYAELSYSIEEKVFSNGYLLVKVKI